MPLRLIDRLTPVTDDAQVSRRAVYRISDNFLNFWLTVMASYADAIVARRSRCPIPTSSSARRCSAFM